MHPIIYTADLLCITMSKKDTSCKSNISVTVDFEKEHNSLAIRGVRGEQILIPILVLKAS